MECLSSRRFVLFAIAALATALLGACRGNGDSPIATASPIATPLPSPTTAAATPAPAPSIEEEVTTAYLAYWDAYSEAVLNLDLTPLEGVAVGEEFERLREEIATMRVAGVAVRVVVEHDLLVVVTSATTASVVDEVVNNSFFVDPVTKDPPSAPGSGEVLRYTFFLEEVGERWVVTRGLRESP